MSWRSTCGKSSWPSGSLNRPPAPPTLCGMSSPASATEVEIIDQHAAAPSGAPCPSCGCPVEPADKFCPACGTANAAFAPTGQAAKPQAAVQAEVVAASKHFRCEQCGAEVIVEPQQRSYVCP